jgi:hypothetical protein
MSSPAQKELAAWAADRRRKALVCWQDWQPPWFQKWACGPGNTVNRKVLM